MLRKTENILFATNLSKNSRSVFDQIYFLASQLNARIYLLHVIEKLPETYERRIKRIFGEDGWAEKVSHNMQEVRDLLIGKLTPDRMLSAAMKEFYRFDTSEGRQPKEVPVEIIIQKGNIADVIVEQAALHNCDIIGLGASRGLVSGKTVGSLIKTVMKKTDMPLLVVPPMDGTV